MGGVDHEIGIVDTLLGPENTTLSKPAELALDDHGLLYVVDLGVNSIVVVDSLGTVRTRIGKEGSGPGELRTPRALQAGGDTLRLLDGGNGRFAVFTVGGGFIRSSVAPGSVLSGAVTIGADGAAVVGLGGRDSAMAQRLSPSGDPGSRLGRPVAPVSPVWNFAAIKQQIRDGHVPAELRNLTLPVLGPDGTVWLCLSAEGVIERYSGRDSLLWRIELREPEFSAIRDDFFRRNRAEPAANRLFSLSLFVAGQAVGQDLWLLLRQTSPAPTLLLVLDGAGRVRARVRVPRAQGIRGFAVDREHHLLYLLAYDDAALLRLRLPAAVFGAT